jgi:RNA polymerase sigma-70 factor (ECF subfamily)
MTSPKNFYAHPIRFINRFEDRRTFDLCSKDAMKRRWRSPLRDASSILTREAILVYSSEPMDQSSPDRHPSASTLTDAELLNNLKIKQPEALACLYDRYGSVVYGVALKVLQSQSEAEDLTQEIFLSLWQRPIDPAKHGHLLRYLITMTRSRAIDKLRSRSRNLNFVQRWGQTITAQAPAPTPVDRAVASERQEQVRQALTQLSDRQRQVIELAYDAGLSQSEIARQLNEPLGTVKSWTRQGLLKLKQLLRDSID